VYALLGARVLYLYGAALALGGARACLLCAFLCHVCSWDNMFLSFSHCVTTVYYCLCDDYTTVYYCLLLYTTPYYCTLLFVAFSSDYGRPAGAGRHSPLQARRTAGAHRLPHLLHCHGEPEGSTPDHGPFRRMCCLQYSGG